MTHKTLLRIARELGDVSHTLRHPEFWTQHVCARDRHGDATPPFDVDAVSFCLLGACERSRVSPETRGFLNVHVGCTTRFNDDSGTTHEDVLDAIAEARESIHEMVGGN